MSTGRAAPLPTLWERDHDVPSLAVPRADTLQAAALMQRHAAARPTEVVA